MAPSTPRSDDDHDADDNYDVDADDDDDRHIDRPTDDAAEDND